MGAARAYQTRSQGDDALKVLTEPTLLSINQHGTSFPLGGFCLGFVFSEL